MAVARDDLCADRVDAEPKPGTHLFFQLRRHSCVTPDRAAELANGYIGLCRCQPALSAPDLVEPVQELQSERYRLSMHAVSPAHAESVFMLESAGRDCLLELMQVFLQDFRRFHQPDRSRRVLDVVRRESQVDPAALLPEAVCD